MSAVMGIAKALGIVVALFALCYVGVYGVAARRFGYRLFSKRRLRGWWRREAEMVGGPFDGATIPTSRAAMMGLDVGPWPDVLFNAESRTYRLAPPNDHTQYGISDVRHAWAGYYKLRFLSDRYEWNGTSGEAYAVFLVERAREKQP